MLLLITRHRIGGAGAGTMQVITEIRSAAEIPQQQLEQLTHFLPRYPDIQIGGHTSATLTSAPASAATSAGGSSYPSSQRCTVSAVQAYIPPVIKELKSIIKWPIRGYFWAHDLEVYLGHELLISSLELLPIYWPVWYR